MQNQDLVSFQLSTGAKANARKAFVKALLDNVGSEVDPVRLVRRIRNGLRIDGLKKALIRLMQDFNLQVHH